MFPSKRFVSTMVVGFFPFLFLACGPADFLHPLFEPSERMLLSGLEGQWVKWDDKDSREETLSFKSKGKDGYRFFVEGQGEEYDGYLGRLDGACYFEILPDKKIRQDGRFKIFPAKAFRMEDPSHASFFLADGLYLTLRLDSAPRELPEELEFQILSTRQILKLQLAGDFLRVWYLDEDEISKRLNKGEFTLAHIRWDDKVLFTASTEELQSFMLNQDRDPQSGLFTESGVYQRVVQ